MYVAGTTQRVISQWLMRHVWTDWQFEITVQHSHTPIQLNIVKNYP